MERYARLKYYKNYKGTGKEGFAIELQSQEDNEWNLDMFAPCVERANKEPGEAADYIHFSILKELAHRAQIGYNVYIGKSDEE